MKVILTINLLLFVACCHAQVLGGFFDQQDTKDKTMMQQIVLQRTYLSEIKKGYQQTQQGLNTARALKNGTYSLHESYFNSLSQVSPAVKNDPKIELVINYQQQIINSFDREIAWQQQQAILGSDEVAYIEKVYNNLLSACTLDLNELNIVVTPGRTQMKDAERIDHIDQIYAATNDKYKFSRSFIANTHAFALDRQNGKQDRQIIKKLYNIN